MTTATSYEVEAILSVRDMMSEKIRRVMDLTDKLADNFERLKAASRGLFRDTGVTALSRKIAELSPRIDKISVGFDRLADAGTVGFDKLTAAADVATKSVAGLKTSLGEAAMEARAIRLPTVRIPGTRARGGHEEGAHGGGFDLGAALWGRSHGHSHGGGEFGHQIRHYSALGIGGLLLEGVWQGALLNREVNKALLSQNLPLSSPLRASFEKVIQASSMQTGQSVKETGSAFNALLRGLTSMVPLKEKLALAPKMLQFAQLENILTGISPTEAISAVIGLIHQRRSYTPKEISGVLRETAALSTLGPNINLRRVEAAAGYAMAGAEAAHIPADTVYALTAAGQLAGITNTKAGSWVDQLIQGLAPKGGLAALLSTKAGQRRYEAMRKLGLVGPHGEPTALKMLEHGDVLGLQKIIAAHGAAIPDIPRLLGLEYAAAGTSTARREVQLLSDKKFAQVISAVQAQMQSFLQGKSLPQVFHSLQKFDPLYAAHKAIAAVSSALIDLDKAALPDLTKALNTLDSTIRAWLPGGKGSAKNLIAGGAIGGAMVGGSMAGPGGAVIGAGVGALVPPMAHAIAAQQKYGYFYDPTTGVGMFGGSGTQKAAETKATIDPTSVNNFAQTVANKLHDILSGMTVVIDGERVAHTVIGHAGEAAKKPVSDHSGFDSRAAPLWPSFGGVW